MKNAFLCTLSLVMVAACLLIFGTPAHTNPVTNPPAVVLSQPSGNTMSAREDLIMRIKAQLEDAGNPTFFTPNPAPAIDPCDIPEPTYTGGCDCFWQHVQPDMTCVAAALAEWRAVAYECCKGFTRDTADLDADYEAESQQITDAGIDCLNHAYTPGQQQYCVDQAQAQQDALDSRHNAQKNAIGLPYLVRMIKADNDYNYAVEQCCTVACEQ